MKTFVNDKEITLQYNDIVDCSKPYKSLYGLEDNANVDNIIPYYTPRLLKVVNDSKLLESMDLATFMMVLNCEHIDITIPHYENITVSKNKSNVVLVDSVRHGKVIGLKSNQNTFNFSVMIADESYNEKTFDGKVIEFCPRTYTITDEYGNFHNNWDKFIFTYDGTQKIHFDKFVNPPMAQGFYADFYRNYKVLIERLKQEKSYLTKIKSKYIHLCNVVPDGEIVSVDDSTKVVKESSEQFESVKVLCFESKISNMPEFNFTYIDEKNDKPQDIVDKCNNLLNGITKLSSEYRYICRLRNYKKL
jgi:hypothetical protein